MDSKILSMDSTERESVCVCVCVCARIRKVESSMIFSLLLY